MDREEAIKIIESNCSCSDSKLREACAMFIPELAESEDERMIRILKEGLEGLTVFNYTPVDKILAWLEKQKDVLSERARNITANMLEDGIEGIQRELIEFLSNTINASWVDIIKSADAYAQRIRPMVEKQKESLHISEMCKENSDSFTDIKNRNIRGCIGMALADVSESRFKAYGVTLKECLAYLEKQEDLAAIPDELVKNYKLFCEQGGRELALLINAINGISEQKEQKPVMIQWTGKNLKEVIDFTGKSPKFSEWFKSWEEFENYVHTHNDILKLFCEDGSHYEVPIGAWIVKTPDGYNIPSRFRFVQEPAECIEDSVKFEEGFKAGRESGLRDGQKYVLDNLDSYGLCKPAEWSAEDERIVSGIYAILEAWDRSHTAPGGIPSLIPEYCLWLENRLKSLQPQKLDASKLENFDPVDVLNRIKMEWPMAWEKVVEKSGWSEKDESCLKRAIWYVENPAPLVVKDTNLVLWLESLPERYSIQPKQEPYLSLHFGEDII